MVETDILVNKNKRETKENQSYQKSIGLDVPTKKKKKEKSQKLCTRDCHIFPFTFFQLRTTEMFFC